MGWLTVGKQFIKPFTKIKGQKTVQQVKNAALRRAHSRFIDFADPIK